MAAHDLLPTLRSLPEFRGVAPAVLERLADAATERSLDRGEWLFRQGDAAAAFFVVRSGSVRLFRMQPGGQEQLLQRVKAGRAFAQAAALTMARYPANCAAFEDDTRVLAIPTPVFRELFEEPQVARAVVASLSSRLLSMVGRIEQLSSASAGARLARHLLELPARPDASGEGLRIPLQSSKRDLAHQLGIAPETLSRVLRRWADAGWIRSERRTVVVLDSTELVEAADET